jgi:hypothetical protein
MDMTPTGGSRDNLHSTARIHIRTGRSGGGAAARGARLLDAVARVLAEPMRKVLGRPVVIDALLS